MKKNVLCGMLLMLCMLCGCGMSMQDVAFANMSEITKIYFVGEQDNVFVSVAVGVREEPYFLNGKSEACVDFCLLSVSFEGGQYVDLENVTVVVDGEEFVEIVEFNTINGKFMADINLSISENSLLQVQIFENKIDMNCVSKDFVVSFEEAVEIATKVFEGYMKTMYNSGNFAGECFLRIVDKQSNAFEELFWCFSILSTSNESVSVVISVKDGTILMQSKI